ncbi:MAG: flagellar basal body rod protein FlgC [Bacteroidetes bacterium]|nr:flagellar basal body rod protein FlgC [Bacteroidota bacterium]MCL5025233.1 flagellar basal body rod protein FlgC [Chloroflexota bacterium]
MSILTGLNISGSALTAQRLRMDVIANNIANAESTQPAGGQPYKRQEVVFSPISSSPLSSAPFAPVRGDARQSLQEGVQVDAILEDDAPPRMVYDPGHPDANANGYVAYPDVDIVTEMTDMMSATRAYEANVTAINATKSMAVKALEILRG